MPERTNPFQQLVTLIQEALVPHGAKVTPSAMVPSPTSGKLREIDILVETSVGPYAIKIAVEAKDEGRKLDATKMETIIGKYRGRGSLVVNKIVVVSHRGFTPEAETRAKDEDIELLTLEEAEAADWRRFLPQNFNLHFDPFPLDIDFDPALPADVDKRTAMNQGHFICRCHGYDYGTPHFWMHQFIFHQLLPNSVLLTKMHDVAVNAMGKADLHVTMPVNNNVLRVNEQDYPVSNVTMHFRYVHATGPMESKTYEVSGKSGKTTVIHSQGIVGQFDVKLLLPVGVPEARGILKVEGGPLPQSIEEYKGPVWHWKDGQWVKEEKQ